MCVREKESVCVGERASVCVEEIFGHDNGLVRRVFKNPEAAMAKFKAFSIQI